MTLRELAWTATWLFVSVAAAQRLAFDAVSIKPTPPSLGMAHFNASNPGDLNVEGITVQELIVRAYKLLPSQIVDLPGWALTERFDIQAKMMDPANDPAATHLLAAGKASSRVSAALALQPERIQSLLSDYFALKAQDSTRNSTVYALVVARPGKLREASTATPVRIQQGLIRGEGVPMNLIVRQLAYQLDHVLLDKTNLAGFYTVDLNWNPDEGSGSTSTAPALRTALQEQLGLKIETQKAPVPVLVITHVERPKAN